MTKVAGGAPASTLVSVANLDPAAEHFDYNPVFDVRDLINVVRADVCVLDIVDPWGVVGGCIGNNKRAVWFWLMSLLTVCRLFTRPRLK